MRAVALVHNPPHGFGHGDRSGGGGGGEVDEPAGVGGRHTGKRRTGIGSEPVDGGAVGAGGEEAGLIESKTGVGLGHGRELQVTAEGRQIEAVISTAAIDKEEEAGFIDREIADVAPGAIAPQVSDFGD